MTKELIKRLGKPVFGLGVLAILLNHLDFEKLVQKVSEVNFSWFFLALIIAVVANLTCAFRWQKLIQLISCLLGYQDLVRLYFQGITANTVLPGGIISGDVWRIVGLKRLGMDRRTAAQSVIFDRISGLWALSVLALASLLFSDVRASIVTVGSTYDFLIFYLALVILIAFMPLAGSLLPRASLVPRLIFKTSGISLVSQILTIISFWFCLKSAGSGPELMPLVGISLGIFLGAAIPASIGGFGSREAAAVLFLPLLGIEPELAFSGSILFGLTATFQGFFSIPKMMVNR